MIRFAPKQFDAYHSIMVPSRWFGCTRDKENGLKDSSETDSYSGFTCNSLSNWNLKPIGYVQCLPYQRKFGVPKQSTINNEVSPRQKATIKIFPEFSDGLNGLEKFDFIWIVSMLHLNKGFKLTIAPQASAVVEGAGAPPPNVGLFSSRAPHRPNPIGLSAVRIVNVNCIDSTIDIDGIDLLDGTPVLDIKPYVAAFDAFPDASAGWMDDVMPKEQARNNGYQTIVSKRGVRAERLRQKKLHERGAEGRKL